MASMTVPINSGYGIINAGMSGSASEKLGCWMEYKVISQSMENNTSTVRFYVYLANVASSSGYNVYSADHSGDNRGSMTVTANGSTVYTRTKRGFATDLIPSASSYTTQYRTSYSSSSGKRFLTILTDNASTEASAYGECTIAHRSDGTGQVTLAWTADCTFSSAIKICTGSLTIALPTIPIATVPVVGTLTMGSASTITLSPVSASYTHTLRYAVGNASATIVTKTSQTAVSWTPSLSLANQVPNATSAVGTLYCDTYNGSSLVGTKAVTITLNVPSSVKPSASYTLADTDAGIAAKFSAFVQSKTRLSVTVSASGAYGSTVSSVSTSINGMTYTGTSFVTEPLTGSGTQSISITVKDSRARTTTVNGSYSVLPYSGPSLSGVHVFRCNSSGVLSHTGTYISVTLKSVISPLNSRNDAAVKIWSKRKSATDYTLLKTVSGSYSLDTTYVTGGSLSNQYAYDIKITAADYFETAEAFADIATADTILSIRNNGLGMAIGKISEQNLFEVGWDSVFHEDVTFEGDVTFSDLSWLVDLIYPVGSIRMTSSTVGAATFMGGTWELWGSGRVPVGVNSSDTDFNAAEKTGGAKTVSLSTSNLPSHSHTLSSGTVTIGSESGHTHQAASGTYKVGSGSGSSYKYFTNDGSTGPAETSSGSSHTHTASLSGSTGTSGSGTAHNNMPPYITCYMYKRIS